MTVKPLVTRTTDRYGSVYHVVTRDGAFVGFMAKQCDGRWTAVYPDGSYVPNVSVTKAVTLLDESAVVTTTPAERSRCTDCDGLLVQAFGTTRAYDRCQRCGHVFPATRVDVVPSAR